MLTGREITLRARFNGGGGPQIGEVTCGLSPHLSCKHGPIKKFNLFVTACNGA